jgi:hypothetical protein
MARKKVPVTLRSVIQRINRRLDDDGKTLMAARSQGAREAIGDPAVLSIRRPWPAREHS